MALSARILIAQRLSNACNNHRREQMGSRAEGPFTRVAFFYTRSGITMSHMHRPTGSRGDSVYVISNTF